MRRTFTPCPLFGNRHKWAHYGNEVLAMRFVGVYKCQCGAKKTGAVK